MAKSLRAKAKMAGRRKKREQGNYHAADAARVARISAKLLGKHPKAEGEEDEEVMEGEDAEEIAEGDEEMKEEPKKISTSGPKDSGRQKWKEAKGFTKAKRQTNSRGQLQGKRSGKNKRRR